MTAEPEAYAARLQIDYPERLDRVTTFLRVLWAIPIAVILGLITASGGTRVVTETGETVRRSGGGIMGGLAIATALMIVFRQRYPRWWFDFERELVRFGTRVAAYLMLLTDTYPSTVEEQSVHLEIDYPDVERDLNRWLPLVKWLLAIPHVIVLMVLSIIAVFAIIVAWFAILVTGRRLEDLLPILPHAVLDGGVRLERHLELEAVPEDRGDERHLAPLHRLLFNNRGKREELVHAQIASSCRGENLRRDPFPQARHHPRKDLLRHHALDELVGVGKQIALDAVRRDLDRPEEGAVPRDSENVVGQGEPLVLELAGELRHSRALAKDDVVLEHLTAFDQGEDGQRIGTLRDLVFAGLQRAHAPSRDGEEQESEWASDEARVVELAGYLEEAAVGRDLDDARPTPDPRGRAENPPGLKPQEQRDRGQQHR